MGTYRLDPILPNDPGWQLSTIREGVFVVAETPEKARELVASKTMVVRALKPSEPKPLSPWLIPAMSLCIWETRKNDIPNGVVVTLDGRPI
jgi:hypothetical protein